MNKELAVEVSGLVKVYHDGDHPVPVLSDVTDRIVARSKNSRATYLKQIREAGDRGPARGRLACAKGGGKWPIVTAPMRRLACAASPGSLTMNG